jgi:hypothetical protein
MKEQKEKYDTTIADLKKDHEKEIKSKDDELLNRAQKIEDLERGKTKHDADMEGLKKNHLALMELVKKDHEKEIKSKDDELLNRAQKIEDLLLKQPKEIEDFKREKAEFSKIETPQPKAEYSIPQPQITAKATVETETIQTIQKRKIEIEKSEGKVTQTLLFEIWKILCPKTHQEVSMKEQCNITNCKDFLECKVYVETTKQIFG